jgi:hypothetical protein
MHGSTYVKRYVHLGLLFAFIRIDCSPVELDRKIVTRSDRERVYLFMYIYLVNFNALSDWKRPQS